MKSILAAVLAFIGIVTCQGQQQSYDLREQETNMSSVERKAFSLTGNRAFATVSSANFDVRYYRCQWTIDPAVRAIAGSVTSHFSILSSTDKIVFDLSDTLTVDSIIYHGLTTAFQRNGNDGLQIQFPTMLNGGTLDSVSIYYHGIPRTTPQNMAFYNTLHNGNIPVMYTLSEPYGGKEWWPCKNGLTDKTDSMDFIITTPVAYDGVSNGVLVKQSISGASKTNYFSHRFPIATYLVGIAATNYVRDVDSASSGGRQVPLVTNAYPEFRDYFTTATYYAKQSLEKFSTLFGDYPFGKEQYGQTQISVNGGMEHQTNTFIGRANNQLGAHELGHHWFGDKVTCGSWQHIWLNEGFANYTQFIYVQNFDSTIIRGHLQYYLDLITSQPDGSVFVSDTTNAGRIFDNRLTYAKGGYVVHMLRGMLGDSLFFKGIRQYLNDPLLSNKFALTADLQRNLEQVSGRQLTSFFKKWIYGEGYANYSCTWRPNANNWINVVINQTTTHPSVDFYDMPVQLLFRNSSHDTIITVNHQRNGESFWINPGFVPDTMLVDPNYWILAKQRTTKKLLPLTNVLNEIRVYPNPSSDHLYVSFLNPSLQHVTMQLFNAGGQLVYSTQQAFSGADEQTDIPVYKFAKGNYVLKIADSKTITIKKIIID